MLKYKQMDYIDLRTVYLILHIFGVALGAGAAFVGDRLFFVCLKDKKFSKNEIQILKSSSGVVWVGLLLLVMSGIGLFTLNAEVLMGSTKFLAKMTIVAILIVNGIVFHTKHLPLIESRVGKPFFTREATKKGTSYLFLSGVISVSSWIYTLVLGVLRGLPFSVSMIISSYLLVLLVGSVFAFYEANMFGAKSEKRGIKKSMLVISSVLVIFLVLSLAVSYS